MEKDQLFPKEFEYIYCDECKRRLFEKVRDINGK
nr:MAG TPA: PR domain zinc finger protein-binding domain, TRANSCRIPTION [Caudoviricetes sp.]